MARGDSLKASSSHTTSYSSHDAHIFEKPVFQYALIFMIIATFIISIFALLNLYQIKKAVVPTTVNVNYFFTKLNKHVELKGLQNQQPIGGQLDQSSLNTLRQQFPDVYANAKVGDFLLRYQTKLVIYDYNQDRIVNAVNLG